MKIETKLNIGDAGYFIMQNKIVSEKIISISTKTTNMGTSVTYEIHKNPCGSNYTVYWNENEIFGSKEQLISTL